MAAGQKTGGRTKGTPNKLTQDVKQAIQLVAEGLGGSDGMLEWVKADADNEKLFWAQIYPKLLPHTVNGSLILDPLRVKD